MRCSVPGCDGVYDSRGLCKPHYDRAERRGELPRRWILPPMPNEIPPVCICDIPLPDAIGMCADCLRPYKPRFAQLREAWREFYRIRGWELNMLEEAA